MNHWPAVKGNEGAAALIGEALWILGGGGAEAVYELANSQCNKLFLNFIAWLVAPPGVPAWGGG